MRRPGKTKLTEERSWDALGAMMVHRIRGEERKRRRCRLRRPRNAEAGHIAHLEVGSGYPVSCEICCSTSLILYGLIVTWKDKDMTQRPARSSARAHVGTNSIAAGTHIVKAGFEALGLLRVAGIASNGTDRLRVTTPDRDCELMLWFASSDRWKAGQDLHSDVRSRQPFRVGVAREWRSGRP